MSSLKHDNDSPQPKQGIDPDNLAAVLVAAIAEGFGYVRDQFGGPVALLLDAEAAAELTGLSRSNFYRLVGSGKLPGPVEIPGSGPKWRRADLERWVANLPARRRKPQRIKT